MPVLYSFEGCNIETMRRLFEKTTGSSGSVENESKVSSLPSNHLSRTNSSNSLKEDSPRGKKSRIFQTRANKLEAKFSSMEDAKVVSSIQTAAQKLKSVIDEILNDSSALAGDSVSGFERLIEILDSEEEKISSHDNPSGYGCLNTLLSFREHKKFVEICNNYDLGNALFNVLRLLRMYEIKQSKIVHSATLNADSDPATYGTMVRVMCVFVTLLESSQTIELLRPSLVKLLVFPLSSLPPTALHFQEMTAELISVLCKKGLSSQIVWYLHDQQAMHHMARQLSELINISTLNLTISPKGSSDMVLRGVAAEKAGMWVVGLKCVIDVITASVPVSPVLMVDFERAGGYKIIAKIVENCSSERSMESFNLTMRLFFDHSHKLDEPLSFPDVGVILSDILASCLGLNQKINDSDGLEKLASLSLHLIDKSENLHAKEFIIQSFSYSLLTIYSNDPRNCNILEEHFHYLPAILVALPSLQKSDTISAILTTLNYVCQCVETVAVLPLVALCASFSIIVKALIQPSEDQSMQSCLMQFDLVLSSYDAIFRSNSRYAMVLINCGWLQHIICKPIDTLCQDIANNKRINPGVLLVYDKLIDLLVNMDRKNPHIAGEIMNCGMLSSIEFLVNSTEIPPTFVRKLMTIFESLALSDKTNLHYSIRTILELIHSFGTTCPTKSVCLIEALRSIILTCGEAAKVWSELDGRGCLLGVMKNLENVFSLGCDDSQKDNFFFLLGSIAKLFSSELLLTYPIPQDYDYEEKRVKFTAFYRSFAFYLTNSGIFDCNKYRESSLSLVFVLIQGSIESSCISTPSAVIVLISILPKIKYDLRASAMSRLQTIISNTFYGVQSIVSSGVISYTLQHYFGPNLDLSDDVTNDLLVFVKNCLSEYVRPQDFIFFLRNGIRPLFMTDTSDGLLNQHLLPPYIGYHPTLENKNSLSLMMSMADSLPSFGTPYLTLGSMKKDNNHLAYLNFLLPETVATFPTSNFSFSAWVQLPNITSDLFSGMIPILSLTTTPSSSSGCFLEVQLCCHNFEVLVVFKHGSLLSTLKFKPTIDYSQSSWTLLTLTYKRGKRFPVAAKANVNVYLNAIQSEPVEVDGLETDISISNIPQVEFVVGKSYIDAIEAKGLANDTPKWNLGPFSFFDEQINQSQVSIILMKGPTYTGNFQGFSQSESAGAISTQMLKECNTPSISANDYLESVGLKGLECVVDPSSDSIFEITVLPKPVFGFSAQRAHYSVVRRPMSVYDCLNHSDRETKTSIGENIMYKQTSLMLLCSAGAEGEILSADVNLVANVSLSESFSGCVASLGGPYILFPILHFASSESQICDALQFIRKSLVSNTFNIRYMKKSGYRLIAFIMYLKPANIITLRVLNELFEFCVDRSFDNTSSRNPTLLLSDTAALFCLVLNHQVWDIKRFSFALAVLQHLSKLVKDIRYGNLNAMRLSHLGVLPWLLYLCVHGAEQCSRNLIRESPNANQDEDWYMRLSSDDELSSYDDEKDAFLQLIVSIIQTICMVETKARDLELISQVILLTFNSGNLIQKSGVEISTPVTSVKSSQFLSQNSFHFGSPTEGTTTKIKEKNMYRSSSKPFISSLSIEHQPFYQLRVYIIRMLYQLFESIGSKKQGSTQSLTAPGYALYLKIFNLEWMLNFIEMSPDVASRSYALRLLGLFVQSDFNYYQEFCLKRCAKLIEGFFLASSTSVQSDRRLLPLALPLIALTFQIPMQFLPYPFQVSSFERIMQLVELEECRGPECSEAEGYRFTLQTLSVLLTLVTLPRSTSGSLSDSPIVGEVQDIVNEIVFKLLNFYFEKNIAFRQLLQHRFAVEIITSSLVTCSNAVDDYGSHIYNISSNSGDLGTYIKEDYLSNEVNTPIVPTRISYEEESLNVEDPLNYFIGKPLILKSDGKKLMKLLKRMVDSSYREFSNPLFLCHVILSFPSNMDDSFTSSFQQLVINESKSVIEFMIQKNFGTKIFTVISSSLTALVPALRAKVIHEKTQLDIFKLILDLIERLQAHKDMNPRLEESFTPIIRDVLTNGRYLCSYIMNSLATLHSLTPSFEKDNFLQESLETVRLNIIKLIPKSSDEYIDSFVPRLSIKQQQVDDKISSLGILESYQLMWSSESTSVKKMTINDILSQCVIERSKVSNSFIVIVTQSAFSTFQSKNTQISNESLRILSLLSIHRKNAMKQILSPENTNTGNLLANINRARHANETQSEEFDMFDDGIVRLLPNPSKFSSYVTLLASGFTDNYEDESRFQDFSAWFSSNKSASLKFLRTLDNYVKGIIPSIDGHQAVRQIQSVRIRDRSGSITGYSTDNARSRDHSSRQSLKFVLSLRSWKLRGISSLASGAVTWKSVYQNLQASPVWGYSEIKRPISQLWDEDSMTSLRTHDEFGNFLLQIKGYRGCIHDASEGPERMRKKLVQDYSSYQQEMWAKVVSEANVKISQKARERVSSDDIGLKSVSGKYNLTETTQNVFESPPRSILGNLWTPWKPKKRDSAILLAGPFDNQTNNAQDIEEFVKEMTKQGIIKRIGQSPEAALFDGNDENLDSKIFAFNTNDPTQTSEENVLPRADGSFRNDMIDLRESILEDNYIEQSVLNDDNAEDPLLPRAIQRDDSSVLEPAPITNSNADNSKFSLEATKSMIIEEVLKGLIGNSDWNNGDLYNVERICGLEASNGLLVITDSNVYLVNGVVMKKNKTDETAQKRSRDPSKSINDFFLKTNRGQVVETTFEWLLDPSTPNTYEIDGIKNWAASIWKEILESDIGFHKITISEVFSVFKRRHHLKYTALEVTDTNGYSVLFSCSTTEESNNILAKFFQSANPPILFRGINSFKNLPAFLGINHAYKVMISQYLSNLTKLWQNGEITNFEYLIQLNSIAGRSYLDLTQYPVFPWVLGDYVSSSIDLSNPTVYRDLSRPMGALGLKRSFQFKERFKSMDEFKNEDVENSPPPFHYGTHYSCAGYVLYYLIRLQPYSSYAMDLQGGQFDVSDRLFSSIESSWRSASSENLQDVRELTPEFYYLPEFLMNIHEFNFGTTQKGFEVKEVELPPWAKNDPHKFIRIQREALESKYVSEKLNEWIDLIFGYKQRGAAAEAAMNVFIHMTYEGEVDIDAISDPVMQMATIAQINNFGQTPSMLFHRPHPKKIVPEVIKKSSDSYVSVDSSAVAYHAHLNPPLSVVGAPSLTSLSRVSYQQILSSSNSLGTIVSDICVLSGNKLGATCRGSCYYPPNNKKVVKFESLFGGIIISPIPNVTAIQRDQEKDVSVFDSLHNREITCLSLTSNGDMMATGSSDMSIRMWAIDTRSPREMTIEHMFTFVGHTDTITCLDICSEYSIVVSGSSDHRVGVWDTRTGKLRFMIDRHLSSVLSVSINTNSGNIVSVSSTHIQISTINGDVVCFERFSDHSGEGIALTRATVVLAPSSSEWQEGVIAITGHEGGYIHLWKLYQIKPDARGRTSSSSSQSEDLKSAIEPIISRKRLILAYSPARTHKASISCLKLMASGLTHSSRIKDFVDRTFDENLSMELYAGDVDGFVSRFAALRLDQLSQAEIQGALYLSS